MQLDSDLRASVEETVDAAPADFFITDNYRDLGYVQVLQSIHEHLKPKRYFEVGTLHGDTLALATCASLAVDPYFSIERDIIGRKPSCLIYQMASDAFFQDHNLTVLLGGSFDVAFLDGMHWFEFLLRDFINTETHARKNSVILLHDCIPTDSYIARRDVNDRSLATHSPHYDWWAGDVWKCVAILLKYRPDLRIYGCRASPTGLVAITGLDPLSMTLSEGYFDIISEFRDQAPTVDNYGRYLSSLPMIAPNDFLSFERLASLFWI